MDWSRKTEATALLGRAYTLMSPIGVNSRNSSTIFPRGELKFVNLLKQGTGQELGNIMFNQFDSLRKVDNIGNKLHMEPFSWLYTENWRTHAFSCYFCIYLYEAIWCKVFWFLHLTHNFHRAFLYFCWRWLIKSVFFPLPSISSTALLKDNKIFQLILLH